MEFNKSKLHSFLFWTTVIVIVQQLKNFVVIKVLTNEISQSQYGQYTFSINFAFTFATLLLSAISISLFQFVPLFKSRREDKKISDLIISSLLFILIVSLLFILIMIIIVLTTRFIGVYMESYIVLILSISYAVFYSFFGIFISLSRVKKSTLLFGKFLLSYEFGSLIAVLISLYLISKTVEGLLFATIIGQIIGVSYFMVREVLKHKQGRISKEMFRKIVSVGVPRIFTDGSKMVFEIICGAIIISIFTNSIYALTTIALSLSNLLGFVIINLVLNFIPSLTTTFHNTDDNDMKLEKLRSEMYGKINLYVFISLPAIILLTTLSDFLIKLISGVQYLQISEYLFFFLCYIAFYFFARLIGINLVLKEKTKLEAVVSTILVGVSVAISYLLIKELGLLGIGLSFMIYGILHATTLGITGFLVYKGSIKFSVIARNVVNLVVCLITLYFTYIYLANYISIIISLSVFIISTFLLKTIPSTEIKSLFQEFRNFFVLKKNK